MKKYLILVEKYAKLLKKEDKGLKAVYMFGSRVKGKARKESDLDVAVISDSFGKDRIGERVWLMNRRRKLSLLIEPHPFSVEEFGDKYSTLASEVKRTGIRVI